jgi:hypothetical protein
VRSTRSSSHRPAGKPASHLDRRALAALTQRGVHLQLTELTALKMRPHSSLFLFVLILLVAIPYSGTSYLKKEKSKTLLSQKLHRLREGVERKRNIHGVQQQHEQQQQSEATTAFDKGRQPTTTNPRNSLYVDEAAILERVLLKILKSFKRLRVMVIGSLRVTADTIAGLTSATIKGFGALCNLGANLLFEISMNLLEYTTTQMPPTLRPSSMMVVSVTKHTAKMVLWPLGKACILTGQVVEELSTGLGEH